MEENGIEIVIRHHGNDVYDCLLWLVAFALCDDWKRYGNVWNGQTDLIQPTPETGGVLCNLCADLFEDLPLRKRR